MKHVLKAAFGLLVVLICTNTTLAQAREIEYEYKLAQREKPQSIKPEKPCPYVEGTVTRREPIVTIGHFGFSVDGGTKETTVQGCVKSCDLKPSPDDKCKVYNKEPKEPVFREPKGPVVKEPVTREPKEPIIKEPREPIVKEPKEPVIKEPKEPRYRGDI